VALYNRAIGKAARIVILAVLIAATIVAALVFRFLLHTETVSTHFMYLPIALACMWWGLPGIVVAAGLSLLVMSFHLLGVGGESIWSDAVRSALFLIVGFLIARLRDRVVAGQKALARSERTTSAFMEQAPQGVLIHRDGTLLFANERLCRLLGWEPGSLVGAPLASLARPEDGAALGGQSTDPGLPREIPLVRRDGSLVWVEAAEYRVHFEGAEAAQVSVTDVSARREAEEKRRELVELSRRQEEQLEHSTRLAELGEMAAAISHELNQPLTGIRNYARNAYYMIDQNRGGESEVKNNLRLISEQVDRAARIISQMRELTRRSDSVFNLLELNSVIRESVEFLLPQMRLSEVTVSLPLSEELPPIWGDRIRLAQVFLNLLSNARQAMEGAPVRRLTVASRREDAAALPVVVEVSDTGKGFSEEQGRRLFQPFYTTRKGGHGLGLSISRTIVQDHKGTIEAASAPGAGATFTIRLPSAQREPQPSGERRD
jgi:PAS domain S-box-containing protein